MLLAPYYEWFDQITCPLEEEQMTAQSHQLSGGKVDGTDMENAERKLQPHLTLLLPNFAEAVIWNSERKSNQSQKGRDPCSMEACILYLTLKQSMTQKNY